MIAPIYDLLVSAATRGMRKNSLQQLKNHAKDADRILICGIGTGLDIPHLPPNRQYSGIDITPGMLKRAHHYTNLRDITLVIGDVMELPYTNGYFDAVLLHLILAVAPHPLKALREAQRVVKRQGHIIVLDKFLKPGQRAPLRRMLNPLVRRIATQTNVVFATLVEQCTQLQVISDQPALAAGWFRSIVLWKA